MGCRFCVEEPTLPDFKIHQGPQSFGMVFTTLVTFDERSHKRLIKNRSTNCTFAQHVLVNNTSERTTEPGTNWDRETHLRPGQNLLRQNALHTFAQNVFGCATAQLHSLGQCGAEFNQLMIEKRNPTLYRSRHAHLILFH